MNVTTYASTTVEWTCVEDPAFRQTERIRELRRRTTKDLSTISCILSIRDKGHYYDYFVALKCIDGIWYGSYTVHPGDGSAEALSNILVSEKDSKLEITADWREGDYDTLYCMKISARVSKSEEINDEELTRGV